MTRWRMWVAAECRFSYLGEERLLEVEASVHNDDGVDAAYIALAGVVVSEAVLSAERRGLIADVGDKMVVEIGSLRYRRDAPAATQRPARGRGRDWRKS